MSHVVQIQTEVRDVEAIRAACARLQLAPPEYGEAKLFNATLTGWQVRLAGWRYPLVVDVDRGHLNFDHFAGRWGEPRELDRFRQSYAVEKARLEARRAGHTASETQLDDGSIKVTIQMGGQI